MSRPVGVWQERPASALTAEDRRELRATAKRIAAAFAAIFEAAL